jgi:hypothetical protein
MLALARAEAERDTAVKALDKEDRRKQRGGRIRRIGVAILVILFCILLPVTYVVTWTHNLVLNTDTFVSTVGPIASNPAVTAAISTEVTNEIFNSLNPEQIVKNALPPKASFLAGPVTNAAKGYVQQGVNKALQSDQFQTLFNQALRFAHTQLVSTLRGNNQAITTSNGQVVLDLVPLFNAALQNLEGFISGVVGHTVTLPTITANDIPSQACERISAALSRPVPTTCGQIPLFPADKLDQARHAVRFFDRLTILLLVLTPVLAALALWLSRRRRRTLLQLSAGGFLGLVVIRRVVIWLEGTLVNTGLPANKQARRAILTQLFNNYFSVSRWILLGLLAVFVIALVTGPYAWAVSFRRFAGHWLREGWNLVVAIAGHARDDSTVEWIRSHLDLLRILGVAVAVILLIALSVSWIGLLVIIVLLAGYEFWLHRIGQAARASGPPLPPDASSTPPDQPSTPSSEAGAAQPL